MQKLPGESLAVSIDSPRDKKLDGEGNYNQERGMYWKENSFCAQVCYLQSSKLH